MGADPRTREWGPGGSGHTSATRVFNTAQPVRPAHALTARSVEEVRTAVRWAAKEGVPVRTHATGHASGSGPDMRDALLVRTMVEGGVEVDPRARRARIPAGTTWGEVVRACAPHGLTAAHGSSPTVGVVGYLLRGGLSSYGRSSGVAANHLHAADVVTAEGDALRIDASTDPELLWALRGGGGGFGIVTSVEVDLFALDRLTAGAAFWSADHAGPLVHAWLGWARTAPAEATTSLRVMNLPDVEEVPAPLRNGTVVCVDGTVLGEHRAQVARDLLDPLREAAPPLLDTWGEVLPADVPGVHMDPVQPLPLVNDHILLRELGDEGADTLLDAVVGRDPTLLANVELRQLGGALAHPQRPGGALDRWEAAYAYLSAGVLTGEGPASVESVRRRFRQLRERLTAWDTGRVCPGFAAAADGARDALPPETLHCLDTVRRRVDPAGLFTDDAHASCTPAHLRGGRR